MTTIACDGRSIASDGQTTSSNGVIVTMNSVKVVRLDDGRIVGMAGGTARKAQLIAWLNLNDGSPFPIEYKDNEDTTHALILSPNGTINFLDDIGCLSPLDAPASIGSGGEMALGAMLAGLDPAEAVAAACKRDIYSGGTITSFTIV